MTELLGPLAEQKLMFGVTLDKLWSNWAALVVGDRAVSEFFGYF